MANNYWMIVQTEENYEITVERGFDLVGLTKRQRKRAQRMEPEDRILFYIFLPISYSHKILFYE